MATVLLNSETQRKNFKKRIFIREMIDKAWLSSDIWQKIAWLFEVWSGGIDLDIDGSAPLHPSTK